MLRQSAAKFLGKQAEKKSIYRLIKQKSDSKKKRLAEISMSLFAFRYSLLLQLSTNYWLEDILYRITVPTYSITTPQAATWMKSDGIRNVLS